jgi:hypothetical protein
LIQYLTLFIMKKNLLTSFILTSISLVSFGQIANGGFETWSSAGNCSNPTGWGTLNGSTGILGICTAQQEQTTVHSGSSALLINTQFIGFPINQTAPGIVTNGTINTNTQAVEGGDPFTERPTSFMGWYQATPVNGDTYSFAALLINEANGDTVGSASFEGTAVVNTWTMFTADVTYSHPENPTLLQIIMLPSEGLNPQVGSEAIFDDLGYESISVGISDDDISVIQTYPNPVVNEVYFNLGKHEKAFVEIFDIVGVKVAQQLLNANYNSVDMSSFSNGSYLWRFSTINGDLIKSGKLILSK